MKVFVYEKVNFKRIPVMYYVLLYILLLIIIIPLQPVGDDWASIPILYFDWELLKPDALWRPFQHLWAIMQGSYINSFPIINHIEVVTMHIISLYCLETFGLMLGLEKKSLYFSLLFFTVSPACLGTLLSIDAMNQTALPLGLIGTIIYIQRTGVRKYAGWLLCSILAVLWKESGIVWFMLTPFINEMFYLKKWKSGSYRRRLCSLMLNWGIGFLFVLLYFIVRFSWAGNMNLGATDGVRYEVSFSIFDLIRNFMMLLGITFSSIDTLAFFVFPRNYLLLSITVVISVVFTGLLFVFFLKKMKDKNVLIILLFLLFSLLCVSFPFCIIEHPSELYAHTPLFFTALIVGVLLNVKTWTSPVKIILGLFIVTSVFVDIRKWDAMYESGKKAEDIGLMIKSQTQTPPKDVLVIYIPDENGYSVFYQNSVIASGYGRSSMKYFDYEYPLKMDLYPMSIEYENRITEKDIHRITESMKKRYDSIWLMQNDSVVVINK